MPDKYKLIALDLDGTLLDTNKDLSQKNLAALERAAKAGIEIVPTTGRFFGGMPECIRSLPFVRYVITINGAYAEDIKTGKEIYKACISKRQAIEIMRYLDTLPVIYDCYMDNDAFMTEALKEHIDEMTENIHARKMLHELRKPVPELKKFVLERGHDVQKIQFFTKDKKLRADVMKKLPELFCDICVTSSVPENVEINNINAHKGAALTALANYLGIPIEKTMAFGDGHNDISMLRTAGLGIAMENACRDAKKASDVCTASCDDDGVAKGIEKYCF